MSGKQKTGLLIGIIVAVVVIVVVVIVIVLVLRKRKQKGEPTKQCLTDGGCPSGYCDVDAGNCVDCDETAPTVDTATASYIDGNYLGSIIVVDTHDAATSSVLLLITSSLNNAPLSSMTCPEQSPYPTIKCSTQTDCNAGYSCVDSTCVNVSCLVFPATTSPIKIGKAVSPNFRLYGGWGYTLRAKINYQCAGKTRVSNQSGSYNLDVPSCNLVPAPSQITIMDSAASGQPSPPSPSTPLLIKFTMTHQASVATGVSIAFIGGAVPSTSNYPNHPNQFPWSYDFNGSLEIGGGSQTDYYGYIPRPPGSVAGQKVYGRLVLKGGLGECESNPSTAFNSILVGQA